MSIPARKLKKTWKEVYEDIPFTEGSPIGPDDGISILLDRICEDGTEEYMFGGKDNYLCVQIDRPDNPQRVHIVDDYGVDTLHRDAERNKQVSLIIRGMVHHMATTKHARELHDRAAYPATVLRFAQIFGAEHLDLTEVEGSQPLYLNDEQLASSLARTLRRNSQRTHMNKLNLSDNQDMWQLSMGLSKPEVIARAVTPLEPTAYQTDSLVWREVHFPENWDGGYGPSAGVVS